MKLGELLKPFLLKGTILLAIALLWEVKILGLECRANIKKRIKITMLVYEKLTVETHG